MTGCVVTKREELVKLDEMKSQDASWGVPEPYLISGVHNPLTRQKERKKKAKAVMMMSRGGEYCLSYIGFAVDFPVGSL